MYVRTTYATGDPGRIDGALDALISEAPGLLAGQPGYRGFGLFADRELGKIMMGSWWADADAERASDAALRERRAELLSPFAGTVSNDTLEAAVFTPSPQVQAGAGFRMTRFDIAPSDVDAMIGTFQSITLPGLQKIAGFAGTALLVNRAAGRGSVGAMFDSMDALRASRGPQAAVRASTVPKAKVTLRSLEEFEVLFVERRAE